MSAHKPDEDTQDDDDQDDAYAECHQDDRHKVVEFDFFCGYAGFEAFVLNLSTICFKLIQTNYKTNFL